MTGNIKQPHGLNRGLSFFISAEWTPEQAAAVFELLDDLREAIWNHYAPDIQDLLKELSLPDDQITSSTASMKGLPSRIIIPRHIQHRLN